MKTNYRGFSGIMVIYVALAVIVVGASGYITMQKLHLIPTPVTNQAGEMSNWQTYRSEQYQFAFKYPDNWHITNKYLVQDYSVISNYEDIAPFFNPFNKSTTTTPADFKSFFFKVDVVDAHKTLDELIPKMEGLRSDKFVTDKGLEGRIVTLHSDEKATLGDHTIIFFVRGGFQVGFSIGNNSEDQLPLLKKILSTFSFISSTETTDTSNWKTFTSPSGYSLKYPPEELEVGEMHDGVNSAIFSRLNHPLSGVVAQVQYFPGTVDDAVRTFPDDNQYHPQRILSTTPTTVGGKEAKIILVEHTDFDNKYDDNMKLVESKKITQVKTYVIQYKKNAVLTVGGDPGKLLDALVSTLQFNVAPSIEAWTHGGENWAGKIFKNGDKLDIQWDASEEVQKIKVGIAGNEGKTCIPFVQNGDPYSGPTGFASFVINTKKEGCPHSHTSTYKAIVTGTTSSGEEIQTITDEFSVVF